MKRHHIKPPLECRCLNCGQLCHARLADYGVGKIEVHGHKTTHHDWQWESDCCEAPCEGA